MNNKIKLAAASLLCMMGMLTFIPSSIVVHQAFAQTGGVRSPQSGLGDIVNAYPAGATQEKDVGSIAKKIIQWALYLSAIVAVLFIIYGGFLYITSAGDSAQATKGRTALVNAIIGLVIVILSYMIVQIVYDFITRVEPT